MKNQTSTKIEKNIYVETRSGAHRFCVAVHPFKRETRTCSPEEYKEGLQWARQRRVDLLNQKAGNSSSRPPDGGFPSTSAIAPEHESEPSPDAIRLGDVFQSFRDTELAKLAGRKSEASRLKNLDAWFGHLTLGQIDYPRIEKWKAQRLSGLLGSGRNPNRGRSDGGDGAAKPLTKHQKHWRKKQGQEIPETRVFPVSTQSVRHELMLLRRTVFSYFKTKSLIARHGAWLHAHHVMQMDLPPPCEPRDRRLSNEEFVAIVGEIESSELRSAILLALLTTLRRSELMSLQWEDVDMEKSIVRLHRPGHLKSKTITRDVPLLPGACILLRDLGLKDMGPIFPGTPGGFSQAWRRAADRAGIFDVRLHDCRRESISRLIETCKLQLSAVAVFSGHSDLVTLQRHYVRIDAGRLAVQISEIPGAATMMPTL